MDIPAELSPMKEGEPTVLRSKVGRAVIAVACQHATGTVVVPKRFVVVVVFLVPTEESGMDGERKFLVRFGELLPAGVRGRPGVG